MTHVIRHLGQKKLSPQPLSKHINCIEHHQHHQAIKQKHMQTISELPRGRIEENRQSGDWQHKQHLVIKTMELEVNALTRRRRFRRDRLLNEPPK